MQAWSTFYAVSAGAAATLLGLLFVAVSMNAAAVLRDEHGDSQRLAEQAFQNYLTVLLISLLALFPQLTLTDFSTSALGLTALAAFWVLVRLYLVLTKPLDRGAKLFSFRRHLLSLAGFAMLIGSAVRMLTTREDHRTWIAAGVIMLIAAATTVSWELLARIARAR
jgi:hypothetical protein